MVVILEIKAGPFAGQRIALATGHSVVVGRLSVGVQFACPHDNLMSGVHFAVECGPGGCRVIDKNSSNGTFLNGARIREAMLTNGDEIKAGHTIFAVRIVPDDQLVVTAPDNQPRKTAISPRATDSSSSTVRAPVAAPKETVGSAPTQSPALAIGRWAFAKIPAAWEIQQGVGIQQAVKDKDTFASSITAMEEPLRPGMTLPKHVEAQAELLREHLREAKIELVPAPKIPGAEETAGLEIHHSMGPVCLRRVYARGGSTIGVLMLVTLEKELSAIGPAYDSVLSGMSFSSKE